MSLSCPVREKRDRIYAKKVDYDFESYLTALNCGESPEGFARWSLRLLADQVVELGYIKNISHEEVRSTLKNEIKPWQRKGWIIPLEQSSSFVANMEIVLDVYKRPFNPRNPVVCMDESPKQLIAETRISVPCSPGKPAKYYYEYKRNGICNIFLDCEPLTGKRMSKITERNSKRDWAFILEELEEFNMKMQIKLRMVMR